MFGVGHGHVPVAHVHRVPGPIVERRVQGVRGEVDGLRVAGAGFQDGQLVRQPIRTEEPAGLVRRDRRAHGRPFGRSGRAPFENHFVISGRPRQAQVVYRSTGQPPEAPRGQPLSHMRVP